MTAQPEGTDRLEPFDRRLDRLAGWALLAASTPDRTEREQCPRPAERVADRLVLDDRLREQGQRVLDVPARGGHQAAGSRRVGEYPHARDPCRVRLPGVEDPDSVVNPAELEQQLDVVGAPPADARLAPLERRCPLVRLVEPYPGRGGISAPERREPQDRQVLRRVKPELLFGQLEGALRMLARQLQLAAMDGDDGDREVVLGHLEPVLDGDVVSASGVRGGELPAPGPELDPGKAPERASAPRLVALLPLSELAPEQGAAPSLSEDGARVFTIACVAS